MASGGRRRVLAECGDDGTLRVFVSRFGTDEACCEELIRIRFPEGWQCPECGNRRYATVGGRAKMRQCTWCRRQLSVTEGTVMQFSKIPLAKWSLAIYLMATSKRGVSGSELARRLGVSEPAARRMLARLRAAMGLAQASRTLSGRVEIDDFYLAVRGDSGPGGVGRGCGRQAFVVAVERGADGEAGRRGAMCMRAVPDCGSGAYAEFADRHVGLACEVRSDMRKGITGAPRHWPGLEQRKFDASDEDARLPLVHHAISNFKAFVSGTYHGASRTRVQGYADEFAWRYSHRGARGGMAGCLLADCCRAGRLSPARVDEVLSEQPEMPNIVNDEKEGKARKKRVEAAMDEGRELLVC